MDIIGIIGVAAGSVAIPLAAVSTSTSVVGISQGVSAQQRGGASDGGGGEPEKDDPRLAKFNLVVECSDESSSAKHLVHNKIVVLRDKKVSPYLNHSLLLALSNQTIDSCISMLQTPTTVFSPMATRSPVSTSSTQLVKSHLRL